MQDKLLDDVRLRHLADSLDCLTEADLQLLAEITPNTAEAWRKRRQGPAWVRIGNRVLYPRAEVSDFILSRKREHVALGKSVL